MPILAETVTHIPNWTHKYCATKYSALIHADSLKQKFESSGGLVVVGTVSEVYQFFARKDPKRRSVTRDPPASGVAAGILQNKERLVANTNGQTRSGITVSTQCGAHPFMVPKVAFQFQKAKTSGRYIPYKDRIESLYSAYRTRLLAVHVSSGNSPLRHSRYTDSRTLSYDTIMLMIGNLLRGIDAIAWSKESRRMPGPPVW